MAEPLFSAFKPGELPTEPETPIVPTPEVNAVVTPPVVIDPPADPPPTDVPEETPPAAEVKEVIREVEKIVEKYPEMDEHTKEIFDALMGGKEDVLLNYLSEKSRDYKTMSDYDVVKANLKKNNPNWSSEDLDIKIEVQYGELVKMDLTKIDKELEPEAYADAEVFNRAVDRNLKLLRIDALDARESLETAKKEIKLPKIQEAPKDNTPSPEAIEQGKKDWQAIVDKDIPELKEFTFKVGNKDEGYEDVSYIITDTEREAENEFFKELTPQSLFNRLGWVDKDGKQNVAKMAGDVLKLERADKIVAAAYTQGKTAGTKGTVAEIKNIDLSKTHASSVAGNPIDIGIASFGHLNPK